MNKLVLEGEGRRLGIWALQLSFPAAAWSPQSADHGRARAGGPAGHLSIARSRSEGDTRVSLSRERIQGASVATSTLPLRWVTLAEAGRIDADSDKRRTFFFF